MSEKIAGYLNEIKAIDVVWKKLQERQNSTVFDKLCGKCEDLFNDIAANNPSDMTHEVRHQIIDILKQLLEICKGLGAYKQYLIDAVTQNITTLEQTNVEPVPTETISNNESNVIPISEHQLKYTNDESLENRAA